MFEAESAHHQSVQLHHYPQRATPRRWWLGGLMLGLLTLSSCANTPWASQIQQSLEADPRLQNETALGGSNTGTAADLPSEIPIYPGAELQEAPADVKANADKQYGRLTYWVTADSAEQVEQFYRDRLSSSGWQIQPEASVEEAEPSSGAAENNETGSTAPNTSNTANLQPLGSTPSGDTAADSQTEAPVISDTQASEPIAIAAQNQDLTVRVAIQPQATNSAQTAFTIQYQRAAQDTGSAASSDNSEVFSIRPTTSSEQSRDTSSRPNQTNGNTFSDINQAPTDLRPYIRDLAELEIVTAAPAGEKEGEGQQSATNQFQPNQPITRREFARWLVKANNTIYADEAKERVRLAVESANPAFEDVPKSDPDFAVIQGLAEVGLVPSALAGNATAVNFRPDAPLTRQDLLLWKVPLDTRQALPSATVEAVQEAWSFQDANKISPAALRAVLADHQNGDFANIPRAFGYTTLLQPEKAATRAEAAAVLWRIGSQNEGITAEEVLNRDAQNSNTGI